MRIIRRLRQRRHQVLATVAFANFVVAALHFGLASAGPQLRAILDVGEAGLGLVLALPALGLMSGTFFWGVLADRFDERRVLAGAFLVFSMAAWWLSTTIDDGAFGARVAVPLFLVGLFGGAAHSAGARAITAAYPEHRRGLALSLRHAAIPLGSAAGGIWIPFATERWSMSAALSALTVLGVAAVATLWLVVPASRPPIELIDAHDVLDREPHARSPLRDRSMQLLCLGCAGLAIVQLGLGSFFTLFLVDEAGMALAGAALVFGAVQASGTVSRVVLGFVSDRTADRPGVLLRVAIVGVALVAGALLAPSAVLRSIAFGFLLVLATSWNGVAMAVAASLAPPGRDGATIGMLVTANAAACAIAPILLGTVLDHAGWTSFTGSLLLALTVSIVAFADLGRRASAARA